jgi:class 3 adenylate cyclase/tetratricopeptide (TPR) repeat protein
LIFSFVILTERIMGDIQQWLSELGLPQLAEVLEREQIDWEALLVLSESDLRDLGLPIGQRAKLVAALRSLRQADSSSVEKGMDIQTEPQRDGANSGQQAERRHLTVMFCDLVGSTELSQKLDPEALRDLMRNYQQCCGAVIEKYEGHVAQYLGDGLMTYFGWPRAHEDDAERAIRAGLEIVEAVKHVQAPEPLQVRVGIATGPVVVGETGDGDASVPKLAVGETPNVAARIQGLAGADQVMIGPDTRRLVGNTFALDDSGEHTLKGIIEPMRAWRVTGESLAEGRFEAARGEGELTPLVGRDLELGLLMDRWALAQDGEGQVVLLSGEPGIGKSRILSALRDKLQGEGAQAMRFQCSPYYINSAFWPSIDNFERVLKYARDESPESKLDKLEALMVDHYQRPLTDVRFIASILSIPCDERYGELAMTPQKFKDETLRTLVDLTEAAAKQQPSVLLFEDLHWADPTTLELLDLMIDRVTTIPLLVVFTHRPEFQNRWADHGHVIGLNLSKLTRAQSAAMVSRVTGGKALPDDLVEQILAKTDGVPLFVEELTKSILESGELTDTGDHYAYAGKSHSVTIPATLRDSLMARLDRFTPVKEIAQIGAAIGREFSYELVSAVAPLPQGQLDDALTQLTDSGLAFRRGTPPDAIYIFKHALVQDAAYDSLLKSRRQELHGKIAEVIEEHFPETREAEPEVLAHHLTVASATEAAIPLWQKAGELALNRMALSEAISHLNKGLELVNTLPASAERDVSELALRTSQGIAWIALKGWPAPEVWTSLHPALELAKSLGRNDALVPILWGLRSNIMCVGRVAESIFLAKEMLDTAKATSNPDLLIAGHTAAVDSYYFRGELGKAVEHAESVLALYDEVQHRHLVDLINQDLKTVAGTFASLATWMLGHPDRAVQMFAEAVAHARRVGHPFNLGWVLSLGADLFELRCEPKVLRKYAEECNRLGRENSLPVLWAVLVPGRYGMASIREGKTAEGIASLKETLTVWDEGGGKVWSPYGKSVLAEAMVMLGDIDDALQLIDEQIEQVERPGWEERLHYAEILRLKGWMLTLKDDLKGAEQNYLASLDWAREQKAKSWELRTSTSLARLWQSQGENKEAHDLLAPVYEWFTEGFDTRDLKEAKALLEELAA